MVMYDSSNHGLGQAVAVSIKIEAGTFTIGRRETTDAMFHSQTQNGAWNYIDSHGDTVH